MAQRKVKSNILALLYSVLILMGTFSLIHGWFPQFYRHVYITMGIIALSLVLVPRFFISKQFVIILLYAMVVFINFKNGDQYTEGKEILDGLIMASCASMAWYFILSDDQRGKKWLVLTGFMVVVVDTIGTFIAYLVQPDIVRALMYELQNTGDNDSLLQFHRFALVEYEVLHGLPALVPPVIMWMRSKKTSTIWKVISWIVIIAILVLLYIGDATTPFLLAVFAIILSLLIVKGNHKRSMQRLAIAALIVTPFLFSDTIVGDALGAASKVTSGELQKKLEDAAVSMSSKTTGGDVAVRMELYSESIATFFESPIVGVDDNTKLGGHSALFDRMGAFGLVGVIPWILFIIVFMKFVYRRIPQDVRDYFMIGAFCFIALMVLKNMSYLYTWYTFMVLLPCMLTLDVERTKN